MQPFSWLEDCLGFKTEQPILPSHRRTWSEPIIRNRPPPPNPSMNAVPQNTTTPSSTNSERAPLLSRSMSVDNTTMAREAADFSYGTLTPVADELPVTVQVDRIGNGISNSHPKITIHCVRHAQAFHNLPSSNNQSRKACRKARISIHDPALTPLGHTQCARYVLREPVPYYNITHILSSPSRRCIQTAKLSFGELVSSTPSLSNTRKLPIVLWNDLKELGAMPCNNGSPIEVLKEEFKDLDLRFDYLEEGWEEETLCAKVESERQVAAKIRNDLLEYATAAIEDGHVNPFGNVEILIFSHGGLLRTLAGGEAACPELRNAQHMSFTIPLPDPNAPTYPSVPDRMPELIDMRMTTTRLINSFDDRSIDRIRESGWKEEELALLKKASDTQASDTQASDPPDSRSSDTRSRRVLETVKRYCRRIVRALDNTAEEVQRWHKKVEGFGRYL